METHSPNLSRSERITLHALAHGNEDVTLDWLALHRLKSFGLVEETLQGPKITAAGRVAIGRIDPRRE